MKKIKLGEAMSIKHGFAFKSENYVEKSDYALITLANISESNTFQLSRDKLTYYGADFPSNFILNEGDLIMPLTEQAIGLLGNSAFIPKEQGITFVLNQRVGKVIVNDSLIDKYYLHYLLSTRSVKEQLEYRASGTSQRNISPENVYDVEVFLPDIETQHRIGRFLYSLEQKSETNKAINDNLEQQLRTIYDYWFTQFDFPDENGNPYRSSGGEMVWNEELKREIPEGWSVMPLLNYVSWESNSQPPKSEFVYSPKKGYVRFIQNRDYDSDGYKTYIPYKHSLSMVDKFDILMDKYGDAGAIRYGIAGAFNVALGKICVHDADMQEYIRSYLGSAAVYNYLHNSCMASTRASLSENNLSFLKIIVPSKELLKKYQEIAHKMRSLILDCLDQNRQCVAIRDWLLPMLMNGQATVAD